MILTALRGADFGVLGEAANQSAAGSR